MKNLLTGLPFLFFSALFPARCPAISATSNRIRLPDEKQIYSEYFDMDYMEDNVMHISNIPDGKYKLQLIANEKLREMVFDYTGRKGLMVEF